MPLNIAIYVVLIAASVTSAVYFNDRLGYTPLFFLICLTLLDIVCTFIASRRLKFHASSGEDTFVRGGQGEFTVTLRNENFFSLPRIRAGFRVTGEHLEKPFVSVETAALSPHASDSMVFHATLQHVGVYTFSFKYIKVYDLLGLFRIKVRPRITQAVCCFPKISDVDAADDRGVESLSTPQQMHSGQNSEYYNGVRDYAPGDSMHSIHWKLTAKNLKYMTRLYENDSNGSLVVVDLKLPDLSTHDKLAINDMLVETAVSAANSRVARGGHAQVVFSDGDRVESLHANSPEDVSAVASYLVRARESTVGIGDLMEASGSLSVIVCTANADMELVCKLLDIRNAGGRPVLIYTVPGDFKQEKGNRLFEFLDRLDMEYIVAAAETGTGK